MTQNAYFFIHHGDSSKQVLVVVYTNYELIPSIIHCHTCMQGIWPQNPVFETLTVVTGWFRDTTTTRSGNKTTVKT